MALRLPGGRRAMVNRSWIPLACVPACLTLACSSGEPVEPAYAAALRPQIEQLRQELLAPAAVVLIRSSALGDWTATFGTRTRGGADPVQAGDQFRIGSCTKTWTGTVILQLVAEGKLQLDDPVSRYQPDVPNG